MGIESLIYIWSFLSLVHTFSHAKAQSGDSNPDVLCVRDFEEMQDYQVTSLELANKAAVDSVLHGDEARGRKAGAPHAAQPDSCVNRAGRHARRRQRGQMERGTGGEWPEVRLKTLERKGRS